MSDQETKKINYVDLELEYTFKQIEIFMRSKARFKVIAKGRRFGLTKGMTNYVINEMIGKEIKILWVDTTYANIQRYIERYFFPELKLLPKYVWKFNKSSNQLYINNSIGDFRSADKPENLEGFGYHLIIVNEAGIVLKNKRLWNESIRPMMLDYKADAIIGGTPKGKKDKKGERHLFLELFERGKNKKYPDWRSFNFTSYDNELLDKKEIKELEKEIPAALRDQEIRGKFIDQKNRGIIKKHWWQYYEPFELASKRIINKIQIWDTAFKKEQENDYSVCETWYITKDGYYLKHLFRDRLEFPELKKKAGELYEQEKPDQVWIEDKASGISLIQELERNTRIPIKKITAEKDKIEYVNAASPIIESGRVFLPLGAGWINDFIDECEDFPNGEFDDQVDIMAKFLNKAKDDIPGEMPKIATPKIRTRKRKYRNYRR